MTRQVYRIHDSVILCLARILQQALLTGTDVSDHMRALRLEPMRDDPETLALTPEYLEHEHGNIQKLLDDVEVLSAESEEPIQAGPTVWDGFESLFSSKDE